MSLSSLFHFTGRKLVYISGNLQLGSFPLLQPYLSFLPTGDHIFSSCLPPPIFRSGNSILRQISGLCRAATVAGPRCEGRKLQKHRCPASATDCPTGPKFGRRLNGPPRSLHAMLRSRGAVLPLTIHAKWRSAPHAHMVHFALTGSNLLAHV